MLYFFKIILNAYLLVKLKIIYFKILIFEYFSFGILLFFKKGS